MRRRRRRYLTWPALSFLIQYSLSVILYFSGCLFKDYWTPTIRRCGSKLSIYDIAGNSDVSKLNGTDGYIKDNYLSNILDYHQKVYARYAKITFPLFNWFNAKIGKQYERTEINSYFSDALGFFMVNLFYRVNDHDIQPYIVYYPSFKVGDTT